MKSICLLLFLVSPASACLLGPRQPIDPSSLFPAIDWQVLGQQMNLPGHIAYDPNSQKCCKGKVSDNPSSKCCGTSTYDPDSQICCDGAVLEKLSGQTCCGKTLYDPAPSANNLCCYGKVQHLTRDEVGHVTCCGTELYRPGSQTCCGDSRRGDAVIAPITQGRNMSCCDKKAYDTDTEVCCQEYSKTGPDVWETNIIPMEGNKRDCCGGKGFDVEKDMCCVRVIVDRNLECCGALGYDPKTEACCVLPPPEGSKIPGVSKIPKLDEDTKCCNGQPYNMSTQACCDLTIIVDGTMCTQPRKEPSAGITTKSPLNECTSDSKKELCCGGIRVRKNGKYDVCCYDVQTDEPIWPWMKSPYVN